METIAKGATNPFVLVAVTVMFAIRAAYHFARNAEGCVNAPAHALGPIVRSAMIVFAIVTIAVSPSAKTAAPVDIVFVAVRPFVRTAATVDIVTIAMRPSVKTAATVVSAMAVAILFATNVIAFAIAASAVSLSVRNAATFDSVISAGDPFVRHVIRMVTVAHDRRSSPPQSSATTPPSPRKFEANCAHSASHAYFDARLVGVSSALVGVTLFGRRTVIIPASEF